MPDFLEVEAAAPVAQVTAPEFSILKQRVDLDLDFANRSLKGSTEITIQPLVKELKHIRLHSRQCRPTSIQAGGITAKYEFVDVYRKAGMRGQTDVHQHQRLREKIEASLRPEPEPELDITLPAKLKIQEMYVDPVTALPAYPNETPSLQKQETDAMAIVAETPTVANAAPQFQPIKLFIEFETESFRDGLHWVGFAEGDKRFPCCYTKAEPCPGNTSCIFPCVDDVTSRCSWDISIRCAKTLGDAFRKPKDEQPLLEDNTSGAPDEDVEMVNGASKSNAKLEENYIIDLAEEDAALDLVVVCVGEQIEDISDTEDDSRHTVTFALTDPITARHVAFAIGPFEHVSLSTTREAEEEERLGQSAVKVDAYCLPGRSEEVRVTCMPITRAIDYFNVNYGSFPFSSYQMLFVDDFIYDTIATAGLSICSAQLLMSYGIIEPLEKNTRILIRTVADQWMGVNVVAKTPADSWAVAVIAGFMSDLYGKIIFGNNAYRWQQKLASEKVYNLDADRPSIYQLGALLCIDSSIREFLDLKSALVLFILDRRLMKSSGSTGVTRIINRIFLQTKTGSLINGELSTADFQRTCEKLGHNKLDPFFKQWVFGAGCPILMVKQRFNKKKLVVEMEIKQSQHERTIKPQFEPSNFMREMKEHIGEVWAPEIQPVFTGSMTIRIHEADGTPYEHIVDIREAVTKLDIPYNTKYKRLKRSRRAKERAQAVGQGEGGEDALLYCLGDILDSEEETREWRLADWTKEDEDKMAQESYEWIRIDADFEWIGLIHIEMPGYMHISQLQQDRDLVAQYDSMKELIRQGNSNPMALTIMVRTLMDRRYFHGIRAMAAEGLGVLARTDERLRNSEKFVDLHAIGTFHLQKAFEELFCFPGEIMPKPNDWSDRTNYIIQCAIPRAMAKIRDSDGKVPLAVRRFFIDKLKFNDNSNNEYHDCHYIATLMQCLSDSVIASHQKPMPKVKPQPQFHFEFDDEEPPPEPEMDIDEEFSEENTADLEFERDAISEIERVRRIDEWITTYHNIYSIMALGCLAQLTKAGIVKNKTAEVLQYTRPSNSALVRLEAFKCLVETGLTRRMVTMKYVLHSIAEDPSPFFRDRLLRLFGEALGHIALVEEHPEQDLLPPGPIETDGLVVEAEDNNIAARQQEAAQQEALTFRKTTPEGALEALKAALGSEDVFKKALWYVANSPDIALDEVAAFIDIAALMYEPKNSATIILKLPRYYSCERAGGIPGKSANLRFIFQGKYKTRPWKELGFEDWEDLQRHKDAEGQPLKYTGPLSKEINVAIKGATMPEVELERLPPPKLQLQAPLLTGQYNGMPPPSAALSATPTTERSGIKLALGGPKRKPNDAGLSTGGREGSPKPAKISRAQTPSGGNTVKSPKVTTKRSPSAAKTAAKTGSRIVKWPISLGVSMKIRDIMAQPPNPSPAIARVIQQRTPSLTSTTIPLLGQQSPPPLLPIGNNFFSSPPSSTSTQPAMLNLGGFRSYGPPVPASETPLPLTPASAISPPAPVKAEDGSPPASLLARVPSVSGSTPTPPAAAAVAKPKKFVLKLGTRPGGGGSGQGSPTG